VNESETTGLRTRNFSQSRLASPSLFMVVGGQPQCH